jgi:hypothetical protein
MNHMTLIARFAARLCARFTVLFPFTLPAQDSIQQISSYAQPVYKSDQNIKQRLRHAHVIHIFDRHDILQARALKGAHTAPLKRVALGVAFGLVGALCLPMGHASNGSISPIHSLRQLADIQLTEKQEYCHNAIVYRESRFDRYAVNGSHHGYYQGRTTYVKGKPDDVQFYWYWNYVSSRYGITEYDEPDMCNALKHLRAKGWQ